MGNKSFLAVIGIILLAVGASLVMLTFANLIPNVQSHSASSGLEGRVSQPKEFLLYEEVFDSGDRVQVNVTSYQAPSQIVEFGPDGSPSLEVIDAYTLDVSIKNSENITLQQAEINTHAVGNWYSYTEGGYVINFSLIIPTHDTYHVTAVYQGWVEQRAARPSYEPKEPWVYCTYDDFNNSINKVSAAANTNVNIQKLYSDPAFMYGGIFLIFIGVASLGLYFFKRGR